MDPSELIRAARRRQGISQRSLARRAGTTQAYVSAIERGQAHPTVEMLRRLLRVMGEELILESRPAASDAAHDPVAFADARRRTPDQRLEEALSWMRISTQ